VRKFVNTSITIALELLVCICGIVLPVILEDPYGCYSPSDVSSVGSSAASPTLPACPSSFHFLFGLRLVFMFFLMLPAAGEYYLYTVKR
jgi:hypothetical protein